MAWLSAIPQALATRQVNPYIFRGYWADVGTIDAFYDSNIQLTRRGAPFNFFHARWPTNPTAARVPRSGVPALAVQ